LETRQHLKRKLVGNGLNTCAL